MLPRNYRIFWFPGLDDSQLKGQFHHHGPNTIQSYLPSLRNNSIVVGLIPSNHHVIFVTDVVVATWYVDILVAQPRNLSNIMGLSFSTPSHSALHIHIGCIYMLWMGIWVVRLDNCWVFGHTSKILEQYNSLWIIFDRIFSFNPCTIQQLVARQLRREKIKPN